MKNWVKSVRKWSRSIHRDLSFLFSGVLIVYALSGIVMNHKDSINPNYSVSREVYTVETQMPSLLKKADVLRILKEIGEEDNYTKHYFPEKNVMKVFLKGGSNLVVDVTSKKAVYEKVTRKPFFSAISRLHYNPGKWWTWFSDIFAGSLLVIILTGFLMVKGKKGFIGMGGIELAIGIAIPLIFLFFW